MSHIGTPTRPPGLLDTLSSGSAQRSSWDDVSAVELIASGDGALKLVSLSPQGARSEIVLPAAEYSCEAGALRVTRRDLPITSEGCVAVRRSVVLELQPAADGALIIKMQNRFDGYCALFLPNTSVETVWFTFAAAAP